MRALLTFLASRLTRALIAVWLVSTVVFVVMRLSGDPVPLLLPADAPRSEYARVAKELGTDRVLPALTLGAFSMASIARLTRSALLEVLRQDYVRTARAKGLREWRVVAKHAFRNAAIPVLTITGLQLGTLLGLSVVTETVFAWPGLGRLAIHSIYNRDYPVVQCVVFLSALVFIVIHFAIEIACGFLDPRIRPP